MRIFYFFITQNQTQISSKTRRILKMTIPKLSKEMLKYVSDKQIGGPMCMPQMTFPNVFIGLI